ncbi:ganglioside-induced differentiation-associated protein 1-like isoform X2 [Paramacrobiotus metropolitanus]|nr:ganglioside-induced differentiation-associated protein 1-like isoform X2 [Paramacrobiotus metropolitanus]XP_055357805.1 ganglioside-induced differentiation-associated protein 1-like isoform X2 [Paramacrobiotus metropolitanus]
MASHGGSSDIVLYEFHPSYWSQMARLAFVEKDVPFARKSVDIFKAENYQPDYVKINPACEVPAMLVNGKVVNGSQAIIDYLDEIKGAKQDTEVEALRKRCCALPIGELSTGLLWHPTVVDQDFKLPDPIKGAYQLLGNRPAVIKEMMEKHPELKEKYQEKLSRVAADDHLKTDKAAVEAHFKTIENFLDDLDAQLGKNAARGQWLFGNSFTNADIVVAVLLGRLELQGTADRLFNATKRPNLARYYLALKARPSFQKECVPFIP